jgi:hypothetical protein
MTRPPCSPYNRDPRPPSCPEAPRRIAAGGPRRTTDVLAQRSSCQTPDLVQVFYGAGQGEGLDLFIAHAITPRDTDRVAVSDQDAFCAPGATAPKPRAAAACKSGWPRRWSHVDR